MAGFFRFRTLPLDLAWADEEEPNSVLHRRLRRSQRTATNR
jgi:hypothetical protein